MFTGSFRPTTGIRHLHRNYNFTGSLVETAPKSLLHSCRSELRVHPPFLRAQTIPSPPNERRDKLLRVVPPATDRVHAPHDSDDLDQAFAAPMLTVCHEATDDCEAFEVALLAGEHRPAHEMRDDPLDELVELSRLPFQRLVAAIRPDAS